MILPVQDDVRLANMVAAKAVADAVRTSLGQIPGAPPTAAARPDDSELRGLSGGCGCRRAGTST